MRPVPFGVTAVGGLALFLVSCAAPSGQSGQEPSGGPATGTTSPACDLITPEIAAKAVPGIMPVGQNTPDRPMGSKAYLCAYSIKSPTGITALSVALISPASSADVAKARSTPDCSPVTGVGDFACLQWTGYFRGEGSGVSANAVLHAVRGTEVLEMPYVTGPPMGNGSEPGGNAMASALAQAAVDAGWGNGAPLSVPAAPSAGPPATTNRQGLSRSVPPATCRSPSCRSPQ